MNRGDAVDHAGDADGVVRPSPVLAANRNTGGNGAVDVGEIPRLDVAVGPAGAREHADGLRDLLLDIEADTGATLIFAHQRKRETGIGAGCLRQVDRILEASGVTAAEEAGDLDLAGLSPQLVPFLDFADQLKLLEGRVETIG